MKSLFIALCFFLSATAYGQIKTFMPENDLAQYDGFIDNGMTEPIFNNIIAEVENYYTPIVKKMGAKLVINRLWRDSTVNAQAYQDGDTWYVDMFGGLARRPEVTPDGFAMVVCHELGHHLAGFPFVSDWAANEGQSDYWAMLACAKNIWKNQDNEVSSIDPYAKKLCDYYYSHDKNLCYRELNAGLSLANLLAALNGQSVAFTTPDKSIVSRTYSRHPKAQCRLDTYVAGTLCAASWDDNILPQNEKESSYYVCVNKSTQKYDIQARPRCWFKPNM